MNFTRRYPMNVPGKYYVDDQCTDCDLCRECAPKNICRDDRFGHSYVFKQPENDEEVAAVMEGVNGCPTEAVRMDGDKHDWDTEPIIDWNHIMRRYKRDVRFELTNEVIPYEVTLAEEKNLADTARKVSDMKEEGRKWWGKIFMNPNE